jgi:hypothetical protein
LNSTENIVYITGKTSPVGGAHQRYFGLAGYIPGWEKTYGGMANDYGYCVIKTSDGGYAIAGETSSLAEITSMYLVKTDSTGKFMWQKTYYQVSGARSTGYSVVQTSDGGYAIAGDLSVESLSTCVYLVKADANGNIQWWNVYVRGNRIDVGYSLVLTNDGGYAIAGRSWHDGNSNVCLVKANATGGMQWFKEYGGAGNDVGYSVTETAGGGFAIAGDTDSFGAGSRDVYLVKTDSAGSMQWNKTFGWTSTEEGFSVVHTGDGGFAIAGDTYSFGASCDVYLVKTDAFGNMQWQKAYGGTDADMGDCVIQTTDGGYAIAGSTDSLGADGVDMYLAKTDDQGNWKWSKTYGGTGPDFGQSLVQTDDGGYAIVGYTSSFGAGGEDVYLVKTEVVGEIGVAWTDSTANTITLYRGRDDVYWNYVRVRIWKLAQGNPTPPE